MLILLNRNISNKIVFGGTKDALIVVTEGTLTFNSSGIATLDLSSIAKAYSKSIGSAIAHIEIAGSTVITSTNVADNVVSTRAYNMASGAAFSGQLKCMIYLVLK